VLFQIDVLTESAVQGLLYDQPRLLRRVGWLDYDRQLFVLQPTDLDLAGLTPFCSSVLQAWQVFEIACVASESLGMWLFEEPLFFSNYTETQTLQSASLRTRLREAGCTGLGRLMRVAGTPVDAQRKNSNIACVGLFNRVVEEVCAALPQPLRTFAQINTVLRKRLYIH